ncbi:MAG: lipopolysaccharide transport periplasmic protein LptA [Pseudorhodobacter sp.]
MFFGLRLPAVVLVVAGLVLTAAPSADAQGARIDFGGMRQDTSLPVEVSADQLSVDQTNGNAVFSGNVVVGQGEMRMSAAEVRIEYTQGGGGIDRLHATGGVTLANATDAAEAREAVYTIASGEVVMTGDVLLTQGQSAISGQRLVLNLTSGTGVMEGRVQTVFQPGSARN